MWKNLQIIQKKKTANQFWRGQEISEVTDYPR